MDFGGNNNQPQRLTGYCFLFMLVLVLVCERTTFKVAVDRLRPFRFVLVQEIVLIYLVVTFAIVGFKRMFTHDIAPHMSQFPRSSLLTMSLLDTAQLMLLVIAASEVAPPLTVVFLQANVPFTVLISCIAYRHRHYGRGHYLGAGLVFAALLVALAPHILNLVAPSGAAAAATAAAAAAASDGGGGGAAALAVAIAGEDGPTTSQSLHTLCYFLAGIPAAASAMYKERSLIRFARPMDPFYLSLWLAVYELVLVLMLSPLAYHFQSLGHQWGDYPQAQLGLALNDGWSCALWDEQYEGSQKFAQEAECSWSFLLVACYVLAAVLVNLCIDRALCHVPENKMYRSVTLATFLAFLALAGYTMQTDEKQRKYFPGEVQFLDWVSIVMLMLGLEVYHRKKEPESEFLTQWVPATDEMT